MNKQELEERLETVENLIWDLEMKDHWIESDYTKKHNLEIEKADLKRMLKEATE